MSHRLREPLRKSLSLTLNPPSEYFPLGNGGYQVAVGLSQLGKDFGNGAADCCVFQIDRDYYRYRKSKVQARAERLHKYVCDTDPSDDALRALSLFLLHQLPQEFPALFRLEQSNEDRMCLECALSGETLYFTKHGVLLNDDALQTLTPKYQSAFDALACQVQEDLALIQWEEVRGDWLSALHLCFPNHWSAEEKVGKNFISIHEAVPGFDKIAAQSNRLVQSMINKGPFVRFAWGIATDTRLNHHPEPPAVQNVLDWRGRRFQSDDPKLFLRVERQTINRLPDVNAALFTIHTYFMDIKRLQPGQLGKLRLALASMSAQTLHYKGLAMGRDAILNWIDAL